MVRAIVGVVAVAVVLAVLAGIGWAWAGTLLFLGAVGLVAAVLVAILWRILQPTK